MTGIVAGTFPQSPLPPNPAHPPETTANTSIARSRPEDQFQYIVSTRGSRFSYISDSIVSCRLKNSGHTYKHTQL